jgi:hypothetical protein
LGSTRGGTSKHKLNFRTGEHLTDKPHSILNEVEVPVRSASICVNFKDNEALDNKEVKAEQHCKQSQLNVIVRRNDNTDLACEAGKNDRGSAISKGITMAGLSSSVCETDYRNLIACSVDQTKLVVLTTIVTDNVRVKKIVRWEVEECYFFI